MAKRAVLWWFAAGLALVALACPGLTPDPQDAGNPPGAGDGGVWADGGAGADAGAQGLSLDSACAVLNARRCGFLQRCGVIAPGNEARRECELYFASTECDPASWPARVRLGTLRYDGLQAQACAEGWAAAECATFPATPPACGKLTSPAVHLSGSCYGGRQQECTDGVCTIGPCPKQCRPRGAVGAACEVSGDCVSGLYCKQSLSGGALGTCTEPGEAGAACDAAHPCAPGYACNRFKVCERLASIGESCGTVACAEAAFCAAGASGWVCTARLAEGESCAADPQCLANLLCLPETGRCAPLGPLPSGAPCSQRQRCEAGLACVGTRPDLLQPPTLGSCQTPVLEDAGCTATADCEPPLACALAGDGGRCSDRFADGAPCLGDGECGLFSRCENARCARIPRIGEACPAGRCLYGNCEQTADAGWMCTGPGGPNAPCQWDEQCASLRCVSGACLAACSP